MMRFPGFHPALTSMPPSGRRIFYDDAVLVVRGRRMVAVVPWPSWLVSWIVPPALTTMARAMGDAIAVVLDGDNGGLGFGGEAEGDCGVGRAVLEGVEEEIREEQG